MFVHGFLVDSRLWQGVAERVAEAGMRAHLVDWPLGSHRIPAGEAADLSPRGVARSIGAYLDHQDLHDVILVGNDTGGALCQMVLDTDASRVGAVVLTNCDAFENFPPRFFLPLFTAARHPGVVRLLLQPMRTVAVRHSPMAYGLLMRRPRPAELTRDWLEPALTDPAFRGDIGRFVRGLDRNALVELAPRLGRFPGPVRLAWGTLDRCFTVDSGRRLAGAFTDASLTEIPDATTFVSVDRPDAVADAIVALAETPAPEGTRTGSD